MLIKGSEPSTHRRLISEFSRLYVLKDGFNKDSASEFGNSKNNRENASYVYYETFDMFNEDMANYNIDLAERFIDETQKFLKEYVKD